MQQKVTPNFAVYSMSGMYYYVVGEHQIKVYEQLSEYTLRQELDIKDVQKAMLQRVDDDDQLLAVSNAGGNATLYRFDLLDPAAPMTIGEPISLDYKAGQGNFDLYKDILVDSNGEEVIVMRMGEEIQIVEKIPASAFVIVGQYLVVYSQGKFWSYNLEFQDRPTYVHELAVAGKDTKATLANDWSHSSLEWAREKYTIALLGTELVQFLVNSEGKLKQLQKWINADKGCTYEPYLNVQECLAHVVMKCGEKNKLRTFSILHEAFANVHAESDLPDGDVIMRGHDTQERHVVYAASQGSDTFDAIMFLTQYKAKSVLIPKPWYDPSVVWAWIYITYDNVAFSEVVPQQIIEFEITATQGEQSKKATFRVEVEPIQSTQLHLNEEVVKDIDLFTEPKLEYDDEQIVRIPIPWNAIEGYQPVLKFKVYDTGEVYAPQAHCNIRDWTDPMICITSREITVIKETRTTEPEKKTMHAVSVYDERRWLLLSEKGLEICNLLYSYQAPCEWQTVKLDKKCFLMYSEHQRIAMACGEDKYTLRLLGIDGKVAWEGEYEGAERPSFVRTYRKTAGNDKVFYIVSFSELQPINSLNSLFITLVNFKEEGPEAKKYYVNFGNLAKEDLFVADVIYMEKIETFIVADKSGRLLFLQAAGEVFGVEATMPLPPPYFGAAVFANSPVDIEIAEQDDESGMTKLVVATLYTDIYFVQFDFNNLLAGGTWTHYSQMKNDPYNPQQVFYSHTGALKGSLFTIMVLDNEINQHSVRVYDLSSSLNEVYSELQQGPIEIIDHLIEDSTHKHNVLDKSVVFANWNRYPGDHILVFISDLLHGQRQTLTMMQYPQTDVYHVILNMRDTVANTLSLVAWASNMFNSLVVNRFKLNIVPHNIAKRTQDINLIYEEKTYHYVELADYFEMEPLAGKLEGKWKNAEGKEVSEAIPEVEAAYFEKESTFVNGKFCDLMQVDYDLYAIYQDSAGNYKFAVIEGYIDGQGKIDREMETKLIDPRFARLPNSQDFVVLVQIEKESVEIVTYDTYMLEKVTGQVIYMEGVQKFIATLGSNDEVYIFLIQETGFQMYMKYLIDDEFEYELYHSLETDSLVKSIGYDRYNYGIVVCQEDKVTYYIHDDQATEKVTELEMKEKLSTCYYDSDDQVLLVGLETGIYEYDITSGGDIKKRKNEYKPYKEVFDKEFNFLYYDKQNLIATTWDREKMMHVEQFRRDIVSTKGALLPNAYIPEGMLQQCDVEKAPEVYNKRHLFCVSQEEPSMLKVFVIYGINFFKIQPIAQDIQFEGELTLYETYNPERVVKFQDVKISAKAEAALDHTQNESARELREVTETVSDPSIKTTSILAACAVLGLIALLAKRKHFWRQEQGGDALITA